MREFCLQLAITIREHSHFSLTPQESIIAAYLLSGVCCKQTAQLLSRSESTIRKHLQNIKRKYKCRTSVQLGYKLSRAVNG